MCLRNLFGCGGENGGCSWLLFVIILLLLCDDNNDRGCGCGC